jgi:predicted O-methyltransferase YrrM
MNDSDNLHPPAIVADLEAATKQYGFKLSSTRLTGSLLRTLAATKPGGMFLELGTGTGVGSSWILDGMDEQSKLITVDQDAGLIELAKQFLGQDPRISFHQEDCLNFIASLKNESFDFIFADTYAGKFFDFAIAFELLKPHGIYIVDDMLPQYTWPEDHGPKVDDLIKKFEGLSNARVTKLNWASGMIILTKI